MDDSPTYTAVIAISDPGAAVAARHLVQRHPRFEIVREVPNAVMAIETCRMLHPDVLLIADDSPGLRGSEVLGEIRAESPTTAIFLLATHDADYLRRVPRIFMAVSLEDPAAISSGLDSLADGKDNPTDARPPNRRRNDRRTKQDWTKVFAERRAADRRAGRLNEPDGS